MPPEPTPVLRRLPEQYFTKLLAAAAEARTRSGPRFLDLGRGNPDIPPPAHALEALAGNAYHGYAPFSGLPELRESIAARYAADHEVTLDPEREVAVVPGTKTGIMLVAAAAAGSGDTVLVPDPGYPDYLSGVALAGATPAPLPLDAAGAFQPDFAAAPEAALTILNYPSNPCAACVRDGTFERAIERGGWVLHDLAYDGLAFGEHRARSILEAPGAREVAAELWSPSKAYGMAGWRIGFLVGNPDLVARVQSLIDHVTAGVFTGAQHGLRAALEGDQATVGERRAAYARRASLLAGKVPGLTPPEGTFYAWWRLPGGLTAERLLDDLRIGVAPGQGFGARGHGWARLSLAIPDDDVAEAADRIAAAL